MSTKILIIDDDLRVCKKIKEKISEYEYQFESSYDKLQHIDYSNFKIVLLDRSIDGGDAWKWFYRQKEKGKSFPCIILISGKSDIGAASEFKKKLNAGSISKHDNFCESLRNEIKKQLQPKSLVKDVRKHLEENFEEVYKGRSEIPEIIAMDSKEFSNAVTLVEKFAAHDFPVSIKGETGTGKELIAGEIHKKSKREGKFVAINLSACPEKLIESELFGYKKGAFTGAVKDKQGKIDLACKGTLFLDEIGDISENIQVKLLRVIESKEYYPVGSNDVSISDVRIIAATNKNLRTMVQTGKFREDLFYRLGGNSIIEIPPLRKRPQKDIKILIEYFIRKKEKTNNKKYGITQPVLDRLLQYQWPGNVRELSGVIERLLALADDNSKNPVVDTACFECFSGTEFLGRKINESSIQFLNKIVDNEPVEISYDRIKELQDELAYLFFKRLYKNSDNNWRHVAKKCGRDVDAFRRPEKMKDDLRKIYDRIVNS